MIWMIFAAMTVATVALLLAPLLRARPKAASRAEYDLTVYKDQLAELEREVERGSLNAAQAEAARTEIQRRILSVGDQATEKARPRRLTAIIVMVVLVVPLVGFGVYIMLGQPWLPDQPYSARAGKINEMKDQAAAIQAMVDQLSARLEANPADGKGWAMLGRSLRVLGDSGKAETAYKKAAALLPGDTQIRLEYASLLLAEIPAGSMLPPDFVGLMREVLAIDANNVDALYFAGISEAQTGNTAKARDLWTRLLAQLPEGSPERGEIQKQIDELK